MITAPPANLPVVTAQSPPQRVNPVAGGEERFRDAAQQRPSAYIYRGELLDSLPPERRYQPQPNLQIDPQNRRAISTYRSVANDSPRVGQLLDGLI